MCVHPKLGKVLVEWSDRLRDARWSMAACLALQAVIMGIMNADDRPYGGLATAAAMMVMG